VILRTKNRGHENDFAVLIYIGTILFQPSNKAVLGDSGYRKKRA
jgi:hypothetical protein